MNGEFYSVRRIDGNRRDSLHFQNSRKAAPDESVCQPRSPRKANNEYPKVHELRYPEKKVNNLLSILARFPASLATLAKKFRRNRKQLSYMNKKQFTHIGDHSSPFSEMPLPR